MMHRLAPLVLVTAVLLGGCGGENANEKLASRVTAAIVANDIAPVAGEFNAMIRPKLTRASVGKLSDQVAPYGKLQSVKETTPSGAGTGQHTFTAQFEKGSWDEKMTLDADGKISSFYMQPVAAPKAA